MTCEEEVENSHKAMECSICEKWEHIQCVKERDRPDEQLYEAPVRCPTSRSILYVCSPCRKNGSIAKRLACNELEFARVKSDLSRVTEERLASARQIESLNDELAQSREELERLRVENATLSERLKERTKDPSTVKEEEKTSASSSDNESSSNDSSSETTDSSRRSRTRNRPRQSSKDVHPPGFKEVRSRVKCFSGKKGEDDFQLWLEDYEEASSDCQWGDKDRARWFSWFIEGPAKVTWQRTLKSTEKSSWDQIVTIYKCQYGIHLDPRTAYQRCHELRYEQFGSAQGLLEAMRDYQRMAPTRLTDETLESVLWNKAPVELQKEVREIPDGSVQELLQRLLRAEEVVAERKRRSQASEITRKSHTRGTLRDALSQDNEQEKEKDGNTRKLPRVLGTPEAVIKRMKCFKCHQKGHLAVKCPNNQLPNESTRRITTASGDEAEELWVRIVTTDQKTVTNQTSDVDTVGPTYKADVTVERLKTRALIDNGSQVSLVRTEMLPKLRKLNNWTIEECTQKTQEMTSEPVGAGGQVLGARKIVTVSVMLDSTGMSLSVPCYVLDSVKPLWRGTVRNCGIVLGTNALTAFGMQVMHSNGEAVRPDDNVHPSGTGQETLEETEEPEQLIHPAEEVVPTDQTDGKPEYKVRVLLSQVVHLGARMSKEVRVEIVQPATQDAHIGLGVLVPEEGCLAERQCDFMEVLWQGQSSCKVKLNNWGHEPQTFVQGQEIGFVEAADIVEAEDPLWSDSTELAVRVCQSLAGLSERSQELRKALWISDKCSQEDKQQLEKVILDLNDVFALSDQELGETDLVTHTIDTGNARPVQTSPRRLPYALRKELEEEMANLLATGCIEPSTSPYASALVLVRKKGGGLRVCVDYRRVNKDTVMDKYPIPRIDELIDMVGRNKPKIFTSLDLMRGYHQVRMDDTSKHKTAFVCHMGLFQFRRMPFGLTNAPATFQRLMSQLFSG